jgi:hypothetical protein
MMIRRMAMKRTLETEEEERPRYPRLRRELGTKEFGHYTEQNK